VEKLASTAAQASPDIYTDVQSLQRIKAIKDPRLALKQVSQQFESVFIGMMLKSMRQANAVFEEDSLFNGGDTGFYRDLYDNQLALHLAKGESLGIAKALERQLAPTQKPTKPALDHEGLAALVRPQKALGADAPQFLARSLSAQPPPAVQPPSAMPSVTEPPWVDPYAPEISAQPEADGVNPPQAMAAAFKPVQTHIQWQMNSPREFIDQILPYAKRAAQQLGGLNPLVLVAQAALETGWGQRMLKDAKGNPSNNFFNIKANSAWNGAQVDVTTLEYKAGLPRKEQAQFRQYSTVAESFSDYVNFLQSNPRYQNALHAVTDAKHYIRQLHGAGYATDPDYSQKIISLFESIAEGRYHDETSAMR
jgi:peptidoglycan hydrolase FlgJ